MPNYSYMHDMAAIRTLLDSNPLHPSGFEPIAVVAGADGEPQLLVYYYDPEMLTVEPRYGGR